MPKTTAKISRRDAIKVLGAAAGASLLANLPTKWTKPELAAGVLPAHAQTSVTLPTVLTVDAAVLAFGSTFIEVSFVSPAPPRVPNNVSFTGKVTDNGGSALTANGFVWDLSTNSNPTLGSNLSSEAVGLVPVGTVFSGGTFLAAGSYNVRAYATNGIGTGYGGVLGLTIVPCLVEGTLIALADGSVKKIEDVEYADRLRVWNFDEGCFDAARPLWIKKAQVVDRYNLLEFSDGSSLRTVSQHRIFNKEKGMFTYPMTDDTPVGTTTFNIQGQEVTLTSKRVVAEEVRYYNIITERHINLFAGGILTSCRYNNLYPIAGMKFVKDDRRPVPQEQYGVADKYYEGLRLAEQTIPAADTIAYINRLEALKVEEPEAITVFSEAELVAA